MKFLFVGLGNIGAEYLNTRHNIGFRVIDSIAEEFGAVFFTSRLGKIADFRYRGKTIYLLQPSTYMNLSGKAVRYWLTKLKIKPNRLLIIVDDVALPFGKCRLRSKGSHAGHNGLLNIEQELQTSSYSRLRFGIGNQFSKGQQVDYVLSAFTDEEVRLLPDLLVNAKNIALSYAAHGLTNTMNKFN